MELTLHHVALGAADPDLVAAFYRDLLGLPEIRRHNDSAGRLRSVWLDLGGALLMVERTLEPPRFVAGVGSGAFLLALKVGAGELAWRERRLADAGFAAESRTGHTVYFRDPEGNRIALSTYPLDMGVITEL